MPGATRPNVHLRFHFSSCCAARQSSPLAFITAWKQWNLSEYNETSRAPMESKAHTPCYWMVRRASPLWSLGLVTHGLKNQQLNHEKERGFLSLTVLMPATRLLGAKRSAHQKYTPAKTEQVCSIYLWQHVPIRLSSE